MPRRAPRLILTAACLAAAPGVAEAQASLVADWQAPTDARFLPSLSPGEAPEAAAECLALAITYEAGLEPAQGQEAVAQVILNRVRSPAYPDTVCSVVWQGAERRTGCQFTFTCDGSLRRPRSAAAIASARAVAVRVLAGETPDHVRGATHYHANYVSPYWASSLTRVRQIATHIFYRAPGSVAYAGGTPVRVALAARRPAAQEAPAPATDPAIRNGEYAPWGLSLGPVRQP
jgi:spore germination cell wall hydrolase CwlJ-like protein